jgi:hypothetical protein
MATTVVTNGATAKTIALMALILSSPFAGQCYQYRHLCAHMDPFIPYSYITKSLIVLKLFFHMILMINPMFQVQ